MKHQTVVLDDGFRVAITTAGHSAGVPLVFLHGLSVSAIAYEEVLEELSYLGFYVIAPDAVNHGNSGSLPWGHTVEDMANVLARTLTSLKIDKAVLAGHSMGGAMTVEFAALYPERVHAAILIDAAAGKEHHEGIAIAPGRNMPTRAARFAVGGLVDVLGDGYRAMRSRTHRERLSLLSTLKESVSGLRFVRAAYALTKADTVPLLEKMRANSVPTAVIHAECDQIVPYAAGVSAAELAGAKLFTVQGFHSWLLVDPEFSADLIKTAMWDVIA
ncbi:hydrolase [Mycobacterium phage Achebe]|uniref:Hydrolase n=1 Tax=Mycobacterium phage Backyardigan TaxID=2902881 RepID=G1BL29_9CAUD|nr:esterase/lipase [Mycobacterium phage Backyardigan]AOT27564.1 hydrolase [Mycobacterium phage Badger]APD17405.1 hydrolase [Mycobacterium phage Achebe]ASZ73691.1 hydrolase [Mycobacterium phage Morpher26]QAY05387.1 hydrolase [Mycobacterium phage Katalie136]QFP95725.1 hydrolase [Mycobacterium phage AbbysRanger]QXN74533.1 hydrolase [Mycobacterium Phage PetiteSangsue]WAB09383.1 hydrolase [Mycobacterium phage Perplexer]